MFALMNHVAIVTLFLASSVKVAILSSGQ